MKPDQRNPAFFTKKSSWCHSSFNSFLLHHYQAFDLAIASELPCPELLPGTGAPQVDVRYGEVPDGLEDIQQLGVCFQVNNEELLLKIKNVGKYLVSRGECITIEPRAGVPDNEVRLFLLGSAMGALLHQRRLLPLHACAVEVNGGAAAFLGTSGIGKSSLAEALRQRGYRLLADDVAAIFFSPAGEPFVQPAYPQLKLWADALTVLGKDPAGLPVIRAGLEKYGIPVKDFCPQPRRLQWVYVMTTHNTPDLELTRLHGMDKLSAFMRYTYRFRFLAFKSGKQRHFEQCGRAARHCRVSRLVRPIHPFRLAELADLVEKDWS